MKLRNKKTGKIIEIKTVDLVTTGQFCDKIIDRQPSLTKLNEEWEDYEPKEPLIKDDNARKAVRAWAEANDIDKYQSESSVVYNCAEHRLTWVSTCIEFNESTKLENLTDGETYTITELCGEEE